MLLFAHSGVPGSSSVGCTLPARGMGKVRVSHQQKKPFKSNSQSVKKTEKTQSYSHPHETYVFA